MSKYSIVVIIPAFNEATELGRVLEEMPLRINGLEVFPLVVDDGSNDRTSYIARSHGAFVVRHLTNLGVGAATRTGFCAATELDAEVVVTMDADGQHDPADIEQLVRCVMQEDYDVAIGNRMIRPKGMPASRVAANWLLNAITLLVYRGSVSDSQSGFKCFTAKAVQLIDLKADGYDVCSEIVGEIFAKKLRYKSIPIKTVYTTYSRAKGQHFLNGVNIILQLLVRMMRRV